MKKAVCFLVSFALLGVMLTGCKGSAEDKSEAQLYAMDTYMTLTAYGEHSDEAVAEGKKVISDLDKLLSVGDESSEVYRLNKNGEGSLDRKGMYLLERSLEINKLTDGAFDPLMYPMMKLWGFTDKKYKVPSKKEISEILAKTDISKISADTKTGRVVFSERGMGLDFGGIAKGYASAEVIKAFKEKGVKSAVVSLGGNVQTLGCKPDGSPWKIAVENPDKKGKNYLGVVSVKDKAVITSGGYERFFEENGKRYHHIISPQTGYPAESDLKSVTVVSGDAVLADGLSTALFVLGKERSTELWRENKDKFDMILCTKGNELYVTQGIGSSFSSDNKFKVLK